MTTTITCTRIYIANLGKYNQGELVGEWLTLPASQEEIEAMYVNIGVGRYENGEYIHGVELNGVVYEETAVHDYETDIEGLDIGEYDSLSGLNEKIEALEALNEFELETVKAACEYFGYDIMDIISHLDDFILYPFINDEEELGHYWLEESGCYDLSSMGNLARYFDHEAFGRDIVLEANGGFSDWGFIEEVR